MLIRIKRLQNNEEIVDEICADGLITINILQEGVWKEYKGRMIGRKAKKY